MADQSTWWYLVRELEGLRLPTDTDARSAQITVEWIMEQRPELAQRLRGLSKSARQDPAAILANLQWALTLEWPEWFVPQGPTSKGSMPDPGGAGSND